MIISKEPYEYQSGRRKSVTQIGYKWTFQCDNPNCKKVFERRGIKNRHERANHYCCHPCSTKFESGKCRKKGCGKPIFGNQHQRRIDSGMCRSHHKQLCRKKTKARQRQEMYEMMGNKCVGCGEKDSIFFQIDHVKNDAYYSGNGNNAPSLQLGHYLREPDRYQLLCANCNYAKRLNGGEIYRPAKFTRRKAQ